MLVCKCWRYREVQALVCSNWRRKCAARCIPCALCHGRLAVDKGLKVDESPATCSKYQLQLRPALFPSMSYVHPEGPQCTSCNHKLEQAHRFRGLQSSIKSNQMRDLLPANCTQASVPSCYNLCSMNEQHFEIVTLTKISSNHGHMT